MPITYEIAPKAVYELLDEVRSLYHPRLDQAGIRFGLIFAYPPLDEKTQLPTGPAIKGYGGAPAGAQVKIVNLKDRLTKNFDVEILIDAEGFARMTTPEKKAMIDHELTHVELTGKIDDLGRPKLKLREEDFIVWGFLEVVRRHGKAALEHKSVKNLIDQHGNLLLDLKSA